MAGSAEGTVIACHTKDEFDAQLAKAYEADKLVRTRAAPAGPDRSPSVCLNLLDNMLCLCSSTMSFCSY